jgi:hypothetical protein
MTLTRGPNPREQLAEGVAALGAQDFVRARGLLEPLYFQRWMEPVGQRALMTLIAAEVDGRNPGRRLAVAADLSARLLNIPNVEPWLIPIAESYYLLALELGAAEERLAQIEASRSEAEGPGARGEVPANKRPLPTSSRETMPSQLAQRERVNAELARERDDLKQQLGQLEQQLAARDRELRETKQELERIKKTIKPGI